MAVCTSLSSNYGVSSVMFRLSAGTKWLLLDEKSWPQLHANGGMAVIIPIHPSDGELILLEPASKRFFRKTIVPPVRASFDIVLLGADMINCSSLLTGGCAIAVYSDPMLSSSSSFKTLEESYLLDGPVILFDTFLRMPLDKAIVLQLLEAVDLRTRLDIVNAGPEVRNFLYEVFGDADVTGEGTWIQFWWNATGKLMVSVSDSSQNGMVLKAETSSEIVWKEVLHGLLDGYNGSVLAEEILQSLMPPVPESEEMD